MSQQYENGPATTVQTSGSATLNDLEVKYDPQAEIPLEERRLDPKLKTEIQREAAKVQVSHSVETRKEEVHDVIDKGAEKMKDGVESVADGTKTVVDKVHENIDWTKDKAQAGVEWLKDPKPAEPDFTTEIERAANEKKTNTDFQVAKNDIDSVINQLADSLKKGVESVTETTKVIVQKVQGTNEQDFDKAIESGASKVQTAHNFEVAKSDINTTIDQLTHSIKLGMESVADTTKSFVLSTQAAIDRTKDTIKSLSPRQTTTEPPHQVDFDTAIEREAAKVHRSHNIELAKSDVDDTIDQLAHTAKLATDSLADNTKVVAHTLQDNTNWAKDKSHEGVETVKEYVHPDATKQHE